MFLRPSVARREGRQSGDRHRARSSSSAVGWVAARSSTGWPGSAGATSCSSSGPQLTSGSTFHSAGLVGQLRCSLSLTQMMMNSVELYRELSEEVELETGWREVGSLRLASSQERMEELQRQAAWAETFGLPLHLVSGRGSPGALSADVDRGRATGRRCCQPTATSTRASSLWRSPREPASGGRRSSPRRGSPAIEVDRGRVSRPSRPTRGGSSARSSSMPGASTPTRSASSPASTCRVVPMAHQYVITKPTGLPRDMPTLRDPSLLVYFRGESGGLVAGRLRAQSGALWGLGGIAPDFNNRLLDPDWDSFAPLFEAATDARARARRSRDRPAHQRTRGLYARRRVHPRADRGARVLGGGRVLRPRDRGSRGHGQAHGRVDHRGPARPRHLGDGLTPLRPAIPQPRLRPGAHDRGLRHLLRRQVPGPRAQFRQAATAAARLPAPCGSRRQPSARKPAGNGSTGSSPTPSPATRPCGPPGWAGQLWSPAVGAEHRACRDTRRLFDETSFSKIDVIGNGAAASSSTCAPTRWRAASGTVTYTQLCNPAEGSSATSPSRAFLRTASASSPAQRSATTTWPGSRAHLPDDGSVLLEDVTSRYACFALWGPNAREHPAASHRSRPLQRGVRLHAALARSPSARCRAWRCA